MRCTEDTVGEMLRDEDIDTTEVVSRKVKPRLCHVSHTDESFEVVSTA